MPLGGWPGLSPVVRGGTKGTFKISALSHKKALILALLGIIGALAVSVASFAATSSTSTLVISVASGLGGEFGFVVSQDAASTTAFSSYNNGDTVTVSVGAGANNFAVGDYILIDSDSNGDPSDGTASFHTVTAVSGVTLTVAPDIANTYTSGSVSEPTVYSAVHTWTPALNSATSVTAGNHFIVNLHGLTTSDAAFVELITTNPNELVKNYTYLNRTIGVYVLCENTAANTCSNGTPFVTTTSSGVFGAATDSTGASINATADILTLQNARQQFVLEGGHTYALTVEGGALFTIDTD